MKPQQSREWIAISPKRFLVPFVIPPPSHPSIDDMLPAVMKHCEFPRVVDKHGNTLLTYLPSLTHHYYFQVSLGFLVHNSWSLLLFFELESPFVTQSGLELAIFPPQSPKCSNYGVHDQIQQISSLLWLETISFYSYTTGYPFTRWWTFVLILVWSNYK